MGDNSLYHVLALISKNHKYNKMKSSFIYLLFLYIIFILWGCGEKEKTGNLGETELYFDERLSSISADGDSAFWIGSEAGDIWYMKQRRLQPYNIGADRIYKVVTDSVLSDVRICWIGIRNSGLQKWALGEENVRLVEKYPICNKGCNYSVYDILLTGKKVYVATSQGLYAMSHSEKDSLKLIYPSDNSETARSGKPFIVNNIPLVSPNMEQPFTVVSDNAEMYAYFSVSENMLRHLSTRYGSIDSLIAKMPEVSLQLNDGSLYKAKGRIETVSGVVDPATGAVQIKALFPNPERELLSGSIGNIVLRNPQTDAITIPMTATVELQDKIIAYRLKNGRAEAAYLTVDRLNDGNRFIVKEGLSVGDTLIAEGVGLVREGMSITPKDETK